MDFNICRSNGFTCLKQPYSKNEIDYFFIYCIENSYMGLVPVTINAKTVLRIRISKPLNNQKKGIHIMEEFAFDTEINKLLL